MRFVCSVVLAAALGVAAGCDDDPAVPPGSGSDAAASLDAIAVDAFVPELDAGIEPADAGLTPDSGEGPDAGPTSCPAAAVRCVDESIQTLNLFAAANPAMVTTTATTGGFLSAIDATAGARPPMTNATRSYVYVRFTDNGLERVDIGDEDALESTAWDMAFRRFVVRLNSGVSGPSCVRAIRSAPGTDFEALAAVPAGAERVEEYMTEMCAVVPDGSGLGSPGVALQSYWEYPGCVKMTGNVYAILLADGRAVKLEVLSYYAPAVQDVCDRTGMLPMGTPSGSGNMRIRWAFIR